MKKFRVEFDCPECDAPVMIEDVEEKTTLIHTAECPGCDKETLLQVIIRERSAADAPPASEG